MDEAAWFFFANVPCISSISMDRSSRVTLCVTNSLFMGLEDKISVLWDITKAKLKKNIVQAMISFYYHYI